MRFSRQRQLVYDYIQGSCGHLTADSVYAALKPGNPALSLATVYRNLNQLAEADMLRKIVLDSGSCYFDKNPVPHGHFVCSECGAVMDVETPDLNSATNALTGCGCNVDSYNLVFRGKCGSCAEK